MSLSNRYHPLVSLVLTLCLLCAPLALCAATYTPQSIPNPKDTGSGNIANPDGILSSVAQARLNAILTELERTSGAQVAVVAIDNIRPRDVFSFAQSLFEHWGIGHADRDDGLLILLVADQRTVRLHTGYGLEGILPDAVCKHIEEDDMLPAFRRGDMDGGVIAGVQRVARLLESPEYAHQFALESQPTHQHGLLFRNTGLTILAVIGLITFGIKYITGYFSDSRRLRNTPPAMRYRPRTWLLAFLGGPMLLLWGSGFVPTAHPILLGLALIYVYGMLMAAVQLWRQKRHVTSLYRRHNDTAIARFLRRQRGFWTGIAVLFPLPFLFYRIALAGEILGYRNHARQCPKCTAA